MESLVSPFALLHFSSAMQEQSGGIGLTKQTPGQEMATMRNKDGEK